jgi:hypothetical protein
LQALAPSGTAGNVAKAMGASDTTVSRIKTEKLEDAIVFLYHLGFKVVPQDMKCYPEKYIEALHTMAQMHIEDGPKLNWDI